MTDSSISTLLYTHHGGSGGVHSSSPKHKSTSREQPLWKKRNFPLSEQTKHYNNNNNNDIIDVTLQSITTTNTSPYSQRRSPTPTSLPPISLQRSRSTPALMSKGISPKAKYNNAFKPSLRIETPHEDSLLPKYHMKSAREPRNRYGSSNLDLHLPLTGSDTHLSSFTQRLNMALKDKETQHSSDDEESWLAPWQQQREKLYHKKTIPEEVDDMLEAMEFHSVWDTESPTGSELSPSKRKRNKKMNSKQRRIKRLTNKQRVEQTIGEYHNSPDKMRNLNKKIRGYKMEEVHKEKSPSSHKDKFQGGTQRKYA